MSPFPSVLSIAAVAAGLLQVSNAATVIAEFNAYNSQTLVDNGGFPLAATAKDNASVASASQSYSGLTPQDDTRSWWHVTNTATSVDPATAPYLSFTLTLQPGSAMNFDRFVYQGLSTAGSADMELRWSVDDYASTLGSFTVDPNGNYTMTSVDLTNTATLLGGTVEFRVYIDNANAASLVVSPSNFDYPTLDGTPEEYRQVGPIVTITGTATTVPEPSAALLLGLSGIAIAVRRRKRG